MAAPKKISPLLRVHRDMVQSSTHMSPAVMLGSSFAVAMGIFAWLGHACDQKYGSEPWGVLAGVFLGLLYGTYEVWKVVRLGNSPRETTRNAENPGQSADSPSGEGS